MDGPGNLSSVCNPNHLLYMGQLGFLACTIKKICLALEVQKQPIVPSSVVFHQYSIWYSCLLLLLRTWKDA